MAYELMKERRIWQPQGEVKAVVQVIHGMAEHIDRYEAMAKELNAAGYAVAGINHRGHGPNADLLGYFADKNGWDVILRDQLALTAQLKKLFPGKRIVLLGHSMGSFLAREYAMAHSGDIDVLILSGTGHYDRMMCLGGKLLAKLSSKTKPAEGVNKIAFTGNNKPFEPARTPFDWLSRDEKQVDRYIQDRLCGFTFTGAAFADFFGGLIRLTKTERLAAVRKDLPVYLMSGEMDPVGQMGKGVKITAQEYRDAGLRDVKVKLYPDARHELMNETNREEVLKDLIAYLDKKTV